MSEGTRFRLPDVLAATVFVASLAVYARTAARFLYWGDSGELVAVAHTLGIAHPPGYPLYTLLGALAVRFPLGTPFFRMSVLSATFGAAAAAVTTLVVWSATACLDSGGSWLRRRPRDGTPVAPGAGRLVGRSAAALLGGLVVAFCPSLWSQATVPEVYSLSLLLVMTAVLLSLSGLAGGRTAGKSQRRTPAVMSGDRPVVLLGLVLGLSLAHHLTAVLVVPSVVIMLVAGRRASFRAIAGGLLLAAAGLSLYLYLPLRYSHDPGVAWTPVGTWDQLVRHIAGAQYASRLFSMSSYAMLYKLRAFTSGLGGEIPWFVVALAAWGAVALWKRSRVFLIAVVLWGGLTVAHALAYDIPDVGVYYIPAYAALVLLGAVGFYAVVSALPRLPRGAGVAIGTVAALLALAVPASQIRDHWTERDLKLRDGGRTYVRRMLEGVAENGMILSVEDAVVSPLLYAQHVEHLREDVALVCIRDRASELERRLPGVILPGEEELCTAFEKTQSASDRPVRESVPVGNYLPLLVSMNEAERPIYADSDLARRQFPDRAIPDGILARIAVGDTLVDPASGYHIALWSRIAPELSSSADTPTVEVYAGALAGHGMIHLDRNEMALALDHLEKAAALAPSIPLCRNNLAVAYQRVGRRRDALEELEAALELNPGLASTRFNAFVLTAALGDRERARRELEAAVRLDPANADYAIRLALLHEAAGDHAGAEAIFQRASATSPEHLRARLAHGDFLARRGRYSEAVAAYGAAERLGPGSPDVLRGLGRCFWALDDRDRAIEVMERLVELQPHNPALKYDLALMFHRAGRSRDAVSLLDDVIRILPGMWEARALKASILGDLGRYWEARHLFEEAVELGAGTQTFWDTWSSMERAAGDTARERAVRARSELSPEVAEESPR